MSALLDLAPSERLPFILERIEHEDDPEQLRLYEAALELERKIASPVHFAMHGTRHLAPGSRFQPYRWTTYLNRKLVDLAERRIRRLIITVPVRHGKSLLCSTWFPAWYLMNFPDHRVVLGGYNATFAASFGEKVRRIIEQEGHLTGVTLSDDRYAKADWDLAQPHQGGMVSVGVGNPPTGRGANLMVIDDPIKKREEAYSEVYREKLWEWWRADMRTRLEPDAVVIVIMSRWHEDDLVGRLRNPDLAAADDDVDDIPWEVVDLPGLAIDENDALGRQPGEALCPERYDARALLALKAPKALGPVNWEALIQGRPQPPEGGMFKRHLWRYADAAPAGLKWVRAWDLAASEKKAADYTASVLMAVDDEGFTWIADARRTRAEAREMEQFMRGTADEDYERFKVQHIRIPQDPAAAGKNIASHYIRNTFRGVRARVKAEPVSGDKVTHALPFAGQQGAGNVILVRGPWNEEFVAEFAAFPTGVHDDWVDAASLGYELVGIKGLGSSIIA